MKLELDLDGDREALISPQQLQRDLAFWIEGYYNRERRHSTSGYKNPIDYERVFMTSRILTFVNPRSVSAKSGGLHHVMQFWCGARVLSDIRKS